MIRILILFCVSFLLYADKHERVINGAPISSLTTNAAVVYNRAQSTICSGSLLGAGLIVTAKHCLKGNPKDYDVYLYGKKYSATKKSTYPSADIGVLKIKSKISKGKYKLFKNLYLSPSQDILLFGFGLPNTGALHYGFLAVKEHLSLDYFTAVNNTTFTSGCPGDSGSPAVAKSGSTLYLVGVLSGGDNAGCVPRTTNYFVNPNSAKIHAWLTSKIKTLK